MAVLRVCRSTTAPLPIIDRGWWSLPLEAVGLAICVWLWRHNGLGDAAPPSRSSSATGQLDAVPERFG